MRPIFKREWAPWNGKEWVWFGWFGVSPKGSDCVAQLWQHNTSQHLFKEEVDLPDQKNQKNSETIQTQIST